MTERVDALIGEITSKKRLFRDSVSLSSYVGQQEPQLSVDERLQLCAALVELNIFDWLDYVGGEGRQLASTQEAYIGAMCETVNKVRKNTAQRRIIVALCTI